MVYTVTGICVHEWCEPQVPQMRKETYIFTKLNFILMKFV
jgi:hypothetical protein